MSSTLPTVKLAEYLFTRLTQLGVKSVHGVPGDYNLALLDYVEPGGLLWVGNCNELNAGYAADAYSRIKGLGALITTFGVGELSAANAIAGAYAELAPVVHIVGTPARHLQQSRALVHHTLNDGDYRRFSQMAVHITVAQCRLEDPRTCPQLIDATLQQCLVHSRPVYIELPADMVASPVSAERLQSKIELPIDVPSADESLALKYILERMYSAQQPMILVDGESRAYGILEELHHLIKSTQWPAFITVFGKSCVDERLPNFRGIWKGSYASAEDSKYIKDCDLVLCFGPHFSNTNTYGYSTVPNSAISVLFTARAIETPGKIFRDLPAKQFLGELIKQLNVSKLSPAPSAPVLNGDASKLEKPPADGLLTQDLFYQIFSPYLREGDIILAETGTAGHGCREFVLPPHTFLFKPSTWLSIGYMLPATQGAALAQRELSEASKWSAPKGILPRVVLLIGDGSFQMTVQELSTIIKEKVNLLLILINNDGYTIERCLHGYDQTYNDIAEWRYLQAPAFFGASADDSEYHAKTARVRTWAELEKAMNTEEAERGSQPMLRMIEVMMGREDAPETLLDHLRKQKPVAGLSR